MSSVRVTLPKLHAGQVRVRAGLARFNSVMCGRRFGKTEFGMHEAATTAMGGKRVGWFAPTYKIMDDAYRELLARLAKVIDHAASDKQQKRIVLISGGEIEFWSLENPESGRSRKYHLVIVDEAGIVRNLTMAWQQAIRPTLTDFKGRAIFLGTPKGRGEFIRLHSKGEAGDADWASFRCPTTDNPYIDAAEVEDARRDLPDEVFAQEYEGVPADDGGNPFGLAAIASCVGPLSDAEPVTWGVDLARAVDFTVAVGLDKQGRVCALERWNQRSWSDTTDRLVALIGKLPAWIDATGVGDPIVEKIAKVCPKAEGFKFTSESKQHLMERLAAEIQGERITFPDGVLRAELEVFEFEYRNGRVRYNAPAGFHDDCVCALALAVHGMGELAKRPTMWVPKTTFDAPPRTGGGGWRAAV